MPTIPIDWQKYPDLQDQEPTFLDQVSEFVTQVEQLTPAQKQTLAVFKAAELLNALVQIGEKRNSPERLGPEKAAAVSKIIRTAIRNRQMVLPNGDVISFQEPEIRTLIIDLGCQLFYAGKTDEAKWEQAMALSTAQYISLNAYMDDALERYTTQYPDLFPEYLIRTVTQKFIDPYRG